MVSSLNDLQSIINDDTQITLNKKSNSLIISFKKTSDQFEPSDISEIIHLFQNEFSGLHIQIRFPEDNRKDTTNDASTYIQNTISDNIGPSAVVIPSAAKQKDESVLYGNKINTSVSVTSLHDLNETSNNVLVKGHFLSGEMKEGWGNGKSGARDSYRIQATFTDNTDSIYCMFSFFEQDKANRFFETLSAHFGTGQEFLIKGNIKLPKYSKDIVLYPNDINFTQKEERVDDYPEKRVELHLHTRMSMMDGLTDTSKAFKLAAKFGHKALAITDHGVVQSFPEAAKAGKKNGVKVIFGVEGYLLPDADSIDIEQTYVVFDIETTGLKYESADIIEIGAVKIKDGVIVERFESFINDGVIIPSNITQLTGITNEMIRNASSSEVVLKKFYEFSKDCVLVAHNASFDTGFIRYHSAKFSLEFENLYTDTLMLSKYLLHDLENHKLDTLCEHFDIDLTNHHRASDDAEATGFVFLKFIDMLKEMNIDRLPVFSMDSPEVRNQKKKTSHIIIIAKTQAGLKNLYRIVSYAHLDYFHTRPRIPRSLLSIYRDGLILGSACEQGELYQAILNNTESDEIEKIASFYDYLEIQPDGNNMFMVRNGILNDTENLHEINRKIVSLGEKLNKPVVATGDVHFLNPEDSVYRKILMCKLGFEDAEFQAPLYLKTTGEMMEEFSYLGSDICHKVVIDNPNTIADSCDELKPFPDGTHSPEIPNASEELQNMAVSKAHEIYGDPLPEVVQKRLDKELKSIIGNGYASLYLMAQRLVHKSLSDGYLVGSRGSVGSSLVATMAGITEVNALQPHYVCPKCKYSDFSVTMDDSACGVDLPDKDCPVCHTKLRKQGYEIPFEVFLGFKGDKTPDIDLNFSGEYQPVAHKYVEEMFGRGHAFRAGTISGLAERKAYECVFHYEETTGTTFRRAEVERLVNGCLNVKVTTGQHPGGIVIVPTEDDILDYTPVQYPADKKDKNTITTHFDFHAMDDRLVKLDILGHDDPTALRMLEDLTGLNPREIPLDDPETRSLFSSSEALGIDLSALNCTVGSLAVPEFGTGFVRGVLENTKPTTMEELVRISGLTHGTDVWLNNAEPLVMNKIAKLSEVLCTRDDIMNYLIAHGVEASLSFKTMESVRKGRGITEEMEKAMNEQNIPSWFIDSCKKIKYMFPRGHAVAYVTMAFRIAYYKVHYPLAFYAVYFSVRADAFDINLASGGADRVLKNIKDVEKNSTAKTDSEKKRDKEIITILEVVYEMNLRGIDLLPIDIYKSDATKFIVEGNAIRPPFTSIPGVGGTVAIPIVEKRGDQKFISVEDFQSKTGANSAFISSLEDLGCFEKMPRSNQISLF